MIDSSLMVCPRCKKNQIQNEPLKGILDVHLDFKSPITDWDIHDFLPIEKKFFPSLPVSHTPLWIPQNLAKNLDFPYLYLKNDACLPTGSLKDRASFLVAAQAKKNNISTIVLASTGNAGSSMAGIAASCGLKVILFLPQNTPEAKLIQAKMYGATVCQVSGNYDLAYELSLEFSRAFHVLNRNTAYNPLTIEGKKTVALEIVKQLQSSPDYLFVSAGDGVILSGVYKGFCDLKKMNLISHIPTLFAVQSSKSNSLVQGFHQNKFVKVSASTIADSIRVDSPRAFYRALDYLKKYNGQLIEVSDEEILHAQTFLAQKTGIFTEPASSCAFAGFLKVKNQLDSQKKTILLLTGNGLKDVETARKNLTTDTIKLTSVHDFKKPNFLKKLSLNIKETK